MTGPRWAWAEVDLSAVVHNVRRLRALTPPRTRFLAVVKADGYGHGAVPVARAALAAGAQQLGVATVDEGIALREAGIDAPVLILSEPPPEAAPDVVTHGLVATVTTGAFAAALGQAARAQGGSAPFHLKVDTGMSRIGVRAEEAGAVAAELRGVPGLVHAGTFTHLATADEPGGLAVDRQVERFEQALAAMRARALDPGLVHAANSAATVLHPRTHYDMVRCGIAIYGLAPSPAAPDRVDLRPAMAVRARVSLVKRIGPGEGVSYGLTYRAAAPTTIATLPLGYADGLHRVLSGRMSVLLGGRRCAQVGRVCMDQLMVEAPDGLAVAVGDEAVVVGRQGPEQIVLEELAGLAGTINYELACAFGMRLPRRYR